MARNNLVPPQNVRVDFQPSPKQYELWKMLQDKCPICGGEIGQKKVAEDKNGNPLYHPYCVECGLEDIPQLILGGGAAGGGKAQQLDDVVCTPNGFKRWGDLKEGDIISSPHNSGNIEVVKVHPADEFEFYEVEFDDGSKVEVSEGHLWNARCNRWVSDRIIETKRLYESMYDKNGELKKYPNRISIPLCDPIQFSRYTNYTPSIHPYVLGAILGSGNLTQQNQRKGIKLTNIHDKASIDYLEQYAYSDYVRLKRNGKSLTSAKIIGAYFFTCLKGLKLYAVAEENKFIPERYKYLTIFKRTLLLQGIMDSAGVVERGRISVTFKSEQLAKDVQFLVQSLGGKAIFGTNRKRPDDYCLNIYINPELCFTNPDNINKCRKRDESNDYLYRRTITGIKPIGKRIGRCITVSNPNGLYVTKDFIVTHNSYLGSVWLITSCMRFAGIKAVVARKTLKSLKESTWNTIKSILKDWGLIEDKNYKINNVDGTITFWNESEILMKEMTDTPSDPNFERFGSSEYTIAFIDEVSEISEKAVEVLFSRMRWKTHETFKVPKMLMSTNPTINWVKGRFVKDKNGNPVILREGERYVPFSVFDNPDEKFRQTYVHSLEQIKDPATRERLLYGNWDWVDSNDMACYSSFDGEKNLVSNLKDKVYNPLKPLIISLDFNVIPYMTALVLQVDYERKNFYILDELLGTPKAKENNSPKMGRKIRDYLVRMGYFGKLNITGDPSGLQRSTATEDGVNNFSIISNAVQYGNIRPAIKLLKSQPPQVTRVEFVNVLLEGYDGWNVYIDMRCRTLIEDLTYQKKNEDGTKRKDKVTDPKSRIPYEKYGHASDCLDYALCYFLKESFSAYKNGGNTGGITTIVSTTYNEGFSY